MKIHSNPLLKLLIIGLLFSTSIPGFAQVANYTFQQQSTTFIPLTQGTSLLIDDVTSPTIPIGFPFQYNGVVYDSVHVSEKGWLWFGPKSSFVAHPHPIGGPAFNGPIDGIICAFGNDLIPQLFDPSAAVLYRLTGTAPNRILTVEWRVYTRIQPTADGAADFLHFQIQLLESNNQIRMNYNCFAAPWSPSGEPNDISEFIQVGLRGNGNQDFHIRTGNWGNTTKAKAISQRITFNDAIGNEPRNLRFTWTPGASNLGVQTGNLMGSSQCAGATVSLPFSTTGNFPAGQVFVAQLSAANGVFSANPTLVGESTHSPIQVTLPSTALGNTFKLRVVSLQPAVTGSESNPFIIQNCCNTAIASSGPFNICQGDSIILTAGEGLSYQWQPGGQTSQSIVVKTGGLYAVRVTKPNNCVATASVTVTQTQVPPLIVTANSTQLTQGQSAVLTANGGINYTWAPPTGLSSTNGQTVIATPAQTTTYTASSVLASGCTARGSITITVASPTGRVAPVTVFPGTGTFDGPQAIGMSTTTPGATIYFTTNGINPVIGSSFTKVYTEAFTVLQTTTIRAIAVKAGMQNSVVSAANLAITNPGIVAKPVVTPGSGQYTGSVEVSISCATAGAKIWYTTNGSLPRFDVPNSFTKLYTGPFTLFQTTTIRAIALKEGMERSAIERADFTVNESFKVAPVSFQPQPGQYTGNQQVTLSTSTPDAQIWYTTNGNVPLLDRPNYFTRLYAGPLAISQNTQIRAIAVKPGFQNSMQVIGNYSIAQQVSSGNEPAVQLYPNPSAGKFRVNLQESENLEPMTITVVDTKGKVWLSRTFQTGEAVPELDLQSAGKGLFLVKFVQGLHKKTINLIVE